MVFDCKSCGFEFNSGKELENHEDWQHNFECLQCEETYPMKNQLEEHLSNCLKSQCPHCAKIFKGNKTLKKHVKMKHIDDISPQNGQKTQQHNAVTNENFQCAKCEKIFRNKELLKQHDKKMHKDNESSDDEFDQEMSGGKKSTPANAKNIEDYDEDDLYDEDSSSDEDTGLQEKVENKSGDDKEGNESRVIKSLEEEENHLNNLRLQLKIVKAKSTIETALEQGKVSKKGEPIEPSKPLIALGSKEDESAIMGRQNRTGLVESVTPKISAETVGKPVACVRPQPAGEQAEEQLQMEEVQNRQTEKDQNSFELERLPSSSSKQFCGKETNRTFLHASLEAPDSPENSSKQRKEDAESEVKKEGNAVLENISLEAEATNQMSVSTNLDPSDTKLRCFPCDNCDKSFETEESLVKHTRTNPCGEKYTFGCTNCGKPFNWLASLYRHLKQLDKCHSNETGKSDFGCKYCGNKFQDGESLYHHMKRLTSAAKNLKGDSREKKTKQKDLNKKKRKHECEHCGYTFEYTNQMSRHMKLCTGDSNFKCEKCGHPYMHRDSLLRHMKKSPSCGPVLEPKVRKKTPKRTLAKQTNLETKEKAWGHHGVGKNQTEMLFVSTCSRISRLQSVLKGYSRAPTKSIPGERLLNTAAKLSPAQIGKKQEIRGSRTRVAGLSNIIVRLGGFPLTADPRRDSLDKILNKFGKRDEPESGVGLERRKGSEDDQREEEVGGSRGSLKRRKRGETAFKTKRMRTNAGNASTQDVMKVEERKGGGRIFTIFPSYADRLPSHFLPDLDKDQLESYSLLSRMSSRLVTGGKSLASAAQETKLGEEVVKMWVDSLKACLTG